MRKTPNLIPLPLPVNTGSLSQNSNLSPKNASDAPSSPKPPDAKRKRRSKDAKTERNYICGCGKSYLSYAALYTHARTKHDGVFPKNTTTLHKKRGTKLKKDGWNNDNMAEDFQAIYDLNNEFKKFLETLEDGRRRREHRQKDLVEWFPCEEFRQEIFYSSLLVKLESIRWELIDSYGPDFLSKMDIILLELNNNKGLNCIDIFVLFLIYVFRFVSAEFYRETVFYVVCYKLMIDEVGWDKFPKSEGSDVSEELQEFTEINSAENIPDLSNEFVLDYFSKCIMTDFVLKDTKKLVFFGLNAESLLRVILMTKFFCRWLYIHKFSKANVTLIQDN